MNERDKGLELKVGIFMLLGLGVIAAMTIYFGRLGEGVKSYYHLTVKLPNADGLIKSSSVMLAGAKIGFIDQKPQIQSNVASVDVSLKIYDNIKIPKGKASFVVGSSGLLGDKFVQIRLAPDFDPSKFNPTDPAQCLPDGAVIDGARSEGIEELQTKGNEVMQKLNTELDELKITIAKFNTGVLSDTNLKNLQDTFGNLKTTSANFAEVSNNMKSVVQNANTVIKNAEGAVDVAKQTMTSANAAAGDIKTTLADARKVMDTAKGTLRKFSEGHGLIPTLLSDRELADNIRALAANLRARGVLFYRDTAPPLKNKPQPQGQQSPR